MEGKKKWKTFLNSNFLILNHFFFMMEQKIDPPNLGFWTLTFTFFQIRLDPMKKAYF